MSHRRRLSLLWLSGLTLAACAIAGVWGCMRFGSPGSDTAATEETPTKKWVLDDAQREYLWMEIEHHGNLLTRSKYGFKVLAAALSKADKKALMNLLAPAFAGDAFGQPVHEVRVNKDYAEVVRQQDTGAPPVPLSREQFVDRLLHYRGLFSAPPEVKIKLMALQPVVPGNVEGAWHGTCKLRMFGQTEGGKPGEVVFFLHYHLPKPTLENLKAGGWLQSAGFDTIQTARSRVPHFLLKEVAAQRGIDVNRFYDSWQMNRKKGSGHTITNTGGVYLCDFDRDGILDMLITDVTGITLYKGQPDGSFRDVTAEVDLPRVWPADANGALNAFVDLDGDGWPDLILGGRIYRNLEGKRFLDYTPLTNLQFLAHDASGIAIADYDRDGLMDLYVTRPGKRKTDSWLSGNSGDPKGGNQLWHNKGNWRFENVTAKSGASGGHRSTFTAVWLDANNDGWPDIYVINEFGNGVLLVNQHDGTFKEQQLGEGPWDFGTMGVTVGDYENSGNISIFCANMYSKAGNRVIGNVRAGTYPKDIMDKLHTFVAGSQLWHNLGGLKFEPVGEKCQVRAIGWSYGPAFVDLDNSGWLDLYATCGFVSQDRSTPDG